MADFDVRKAISDSNKPGWKPSQEFEALMGKIHEPCELKSPEDPPVWLDEKKFRDGVRFYDDWFLVIAMSSIWNALLGMSVPNLW